jgi:hypothetical protein
MLHTYILCSEVEVVEKVLGLSLLKRYAKPGQILLLAVLVGGISVQPRLKIYKELNTLLLDISASISLRATVVCPQMRNTLPALHCVLNGAAWLEQLLEPSNHVPKLFEATEAMEEWEYYSYDRWENLLTLDTLNTSGKALSFYPYAGVVEWNEELRSVQVACPPLPSRVVYPALYRIYSQSRLYCNDLYAGT